jgi:hypothetical protein
MKIKSLSSCGSIHIYLASIGRGTGNTPLVRWSCFVQFLPTPQMRAIFGTFRFTSNLQIIKHLIEFKRVAGQLLYLKWVV